MDESNQGLYKALLIGGPVTFFVIVFVVLWKFGGMGLMLSAIVAGIIAVIDYFILAWMLRRAAGSE